MWSGALLVLVSAQGSTPTGDESPQRPPNVVLILADDVGAVELGSYGGPGGRTPHLDRLAANGIRFETCWATPICTPSRVELMTGQYGFRTGYMGLIGSGYTPHDESPLFDIGAKTTFADVLGAAGYRTALSGKWQLTGNGPDLIRDCGFERYRIWKWHHSLEPGAELKLGERGTRHEVLPSRFWRPEMIEDGRVVKTEGRRYGPKLYTEFLIEFMRENRERPFLAYYPMTLCHQPHAKTPSLTSSGPSEEADFDTSLRYADHLVGRLLDALEELELAERTVVVFTADNGSHGAGKGTVDEAGVRVPLLISWPGRFQPRVSQALVDLTDLFPTLAELGNAPVPESHVLDGRSLVPLLEGRTETHREWIFTFLRDERMIRTAGWLLDARGRLAVYDGTGPRAVTEQDERSRAARRQLEGLLEDLPDREGWSELRKGHKRGAARGRSED